MTDNTIDSINSIPENNNYNLDSTNCRLVNEISIQYKINMPDNRVPQFLHFHDYFEVILYINTDNVMIIDGNAYKTNPNDMIVIAPGRVHTMNYIQECPFIRYNFYFSKDYVTHVLDALEMKDAISFLENMPHPKTALTPSQASRMVSLFSQLYACSEQRMKTPETPVLTKAYATILIIEIYRLYHNKQVAYDSDDTSLIRRIIGYMENHYNENLTLDGVASVFFISKYHICHLFKVKLDTTFSLYLQFLRVSHSVECLSKPCVSMEEIAFSCGFANVQHFHRVFKKHLGCTPGEYRKNKIAQNS